MVNSSDRYKASVHLFSQASPQKEGVNQEFALSQHDKVAELLATARKALSFKPTNEDNIRSVEILSRCASKIMAHIEPTLSKEAREEPTQNFSSHTM